ncbi:MAG: hypothetical protein MI723_07390 [Caulobacterales bacterium]|nr:hypothetical protein [Caulobacterales bacterium]
MRQTACTVIAAAAVSWAWAAPAAGDGHMEAIAAMNASLAGHWTGAAESRSPQTGETVSVDDAFTFVVTGEDGIDYAFWGPQGMTWAVHEGDAVFRHHSFANDGTGEVMTVRMSEAHGPDEAGDWSIVETAATSGEDGAGLEQRSTYALTGGVFTVNVAVRAAGGEADYELIYSGSYTRAQ